MTHRVPNLSNSASVSRKLRLAVVLAVLGAAGVAASAHVGAADKTRSSSPLLTLTARADLAEDLRVEVAARDALRTDAQITEWKLFVRIGKGIAYLDGDVPTKELREKAIRLVEQVDGVLEVRAGGLRVRKMQPAKKRLVVPIAEEKPTQTSSASPYGLPNRDVVHSLAPAASTSQGVTLLAPEMATPPARTSEKARLTANPRSRPAADSLPAAVERMRRSNARYQQIRTTVQDDTVYVSVGNSSLEDVMVFAQSVRRLPGVQHVIVRNGSASPR